MEENIEFKDSLELLERAKFKKLYTPLVTQLCKDFQRANIDFHCPLPIEPSQLESLLKEKIYVLLLEKFDVYLNLLYVIDISEEEFKHLKSSDIIKISVTVSFLILKRIYQKVWLKDQYSID